MKRIAKCCCEQAAIEVEGDPQLYGLCHCDNCKRRTGSAFGVSAYFENDQIIAKTGETYVYEKTNWLGDQKRYSSALEALKNGSDYLVVGRPITESDNPVKSLRSLLQEIKR